MTLPPEERDAGLTVNEYETLLMTHDLRDVLRNPSRFMARMGQGVLQAPLSIPAKALNHAHYDAVQLFNELMDRVACVDRSWSGSSIGSWLFRYRISCA